MNYEVLIINKEEDNTSAVRGELVTAKPKGWSWKSRELSSRFDVISFAGKPKEIAELFDPNRGYYYDFSTSQFRYILTDEPFDPTLALDISDLPSDAVNKSVVVAAEIDSHWASIEPNVCRYLHPNNLMPYPKKDDWTPVRNHWYEKFRPFGSAIAGVREVLAVLKFGNYGGFGWRGGNLAINSSAALLVANAFTSEEKEWLRWIWRG